MARISRLVSGGVVAGVGLVAVAGAAWATGTFGPAHAPAATTGTAGTAVVAAAAADTSTTAHAKAARRAHADRLGRAEYGRVTVRRHGADVTLLAQRGTVTRISATATGTGTGSVTVRSVDGHTQVYVVTAASHVREHGTIESLSSVVVGERVRVLAQLSGSTADVRRLAVRPAASAKASTKASASAEGATGATGSGTSDPTGV